MPEFEEDNPTTSQSQNYTPSTDASQKPRTRRRSGGFKTEVVSLKNAKIGEVNAAEAIKEEKLSGQASPAAEPRREPRAEREPRAPSRETNPLPSPETLAAITRVEAHSSNAAPSVMPAGPNATKTDPLAPMASQVALAPVPASPLRPLKNPKEDFSLQLADFSASFSAMSRKPP